MKRALSCSLIVFLFLQLGSPISQGRILDKAQASQSVSFSESAIVPPLTISPWNAKGKGAFWTRRILGTAVFAMTAWALWNPYAAWAQKTSTKVAPKSHVMTRVEVQKETSVLSNAVGALATRYNVLNDLLEKAFDTYQGETHANEELIQTSEGHPSPEGRRMARLMYLDMVYSTPVSDENSRALHRAANELLDQIRILEKAMLPLKNEETTDRPFQELLETANTQLDLAHGITPVVIQRSDDWTIILGNSPKSRIFWYAKGRQKPNGSFEFRVFRADVIHKTPTGLTLPMDAFDITESLANNPDTDSAKHTKPVELNPNAEGGEKFIVASVDEMQAFLSALDMRATAEILFKEKPPSGTTELNTASIASAPRSVETDGTTPDKNAKGAIKPAEIPAPTFEKDWVMEGLIESINSAINDVSGGSLSDPAGVRQEVSNWVNAHVGKPSAADAESRIQISLRINQALRSKADRKSYTDYQNDLGSVKSGTPQGDERALGFVLRIVSDVVQATAVPTPNVQAVDAKTSMTETNVPDAAARGAEINAAKSKLQSAIAQVLPKIILGAKRITDPKNKKPLPKEEREALNKKAAQLSTDLEGKFGARLAELADKTLSALSDDNLKSMLKQYFDALAGGQNNIDSAGVAVSEQVNAAMGTEAPTKSAAPAEKPVSAVQGSGPVQTPKTETVATPAASPQQPAEKVAPKKPTHSKPDPKIETAKKSIKDKSGKIEELTKNITKRPLSEADLNGAVKDISDARKNLEASSEPGAATSQNQADAALQTVALLKEVVIIEVKCEAAENALKAPASIDSPLFHKEIGLTPDTRQKLLRGGFFLAGGASGDAATLALLSKEFAERSSQLKEIQTLIDNFEKQVGDKPEFKDGLKYLKDRAAAVAASLKTHVSDDLVPNNHEDILDMSTHRPAHIDWSQTGAFADIVYRVDSESDNKSKRPAMAGIWVRPGSVAIIIVTDLDDQTTSSGISRTIQWQILLADKSSPLHFAAIGSFHESELLGGYYKVLYGLSEGKDPDGKPLPISSSGKPQSFWRLPPMPFFSHPNHEMRMLARAA